MTCGTCLNECCTCDNNADFVFPDILGDGQITIDSTVEGQITISAPENNTITSDDGTVGLNETVNPDGSIEYDLSVACCDHLVGACMNDPVPSSLDNKLFVDAPLTKTVSNCSVDGSITIGLDTSQIADEKVKTTSGCTAGYLEDNIEGGTGIRVYTDNCKVVIEAEPQNFVKPFCKVMLSTDAEVLRTSGLVDNTEYKGFYALPVDTVIDNNGSGMADWITTGTDVLYGTTSTYIKIVKAGFYRVSFKFNCDINYGIHALRGCVFSLGTPGKFIVLDDKDQGESAGFAISTNATADAKTDINAAKQLSFQNTDVSYFDADTIFVLGGRMDPNVTVGNGAGQDGWMIVRMAGLVLGGLGGGGSVSTNNEAGCVMSVERVSDPDGGILYQ